MRLLDAFRQHLDVLDLEPGPALVAVSGGMDSVVLLDLLVATQASHGLTVIVSHVDHGMAEESATVAKQVGALARRHGLAYRHTRFELGPDATETEARSRRLSWLESVRRESGARVVLFAHHADDQLETVLMRVLTGSGPAGLAGMTPVRDTVVRPLLPFPRQALAAYASERGLEWWDDPANADPRHMRSWLRVALMPALKERIPDIEARLARLGRQARDDRQAWDALLDALPEFDFRRERDGCSVAAGSLARYDSVLAIAMLQAAARRAGATLGRKRAQRILNVVHRGHSGRRVELGGGWLAELAFDRLRLVEPSPDAARPLLRVSLPPVDGRRIAWGRWAFDGCADIAPAQQPRSGGSAWFVPGEMMIRPAQPGERVYPLGGVGRRRVVRCFQDARVPRSRRLDWPVFVAEGQVIWIPGVCRSAALVPRAGTEAVRVDVQYN